MQPKTQKTEELESSFNALADKWEKDMAFYSLMAQRSQHYAYQLILGMGKEAIPLILRRMERQGGHWDHALETIAGMPSPTGKTKLKTEGWYSVDVKEVSAAWLQWGREQGYSW